MDIVETLARLFDVGGVVVVTAMLYVVWTRLGKVTDQLIAILQELHEAQKDNAAQRNLIGTDQE